MTDSANLSLWDSVSRVPPEHLKGFSRSGGFKGTAIKPMWSFKVMTELFGPVGQGWGMSKPEFTVHPVLNEILVYCTVSVWAKDPANVAYGVGGDKVLALFSNGPKTDDEAFKKAYTDALTNALKMFGVGADIHMGLWDGNKYVDETAPPANDAPRSTAAIDKPVTKEETRALKDEICKEIEAFTSLLKLQDWAKSPENRQRKASLHPDFQDVVSNSYLDKQAELKEKVAA